MTNKLFLIAGMALTLAACSKPPAAPAEAPAPTVDSDDGAAARAKTAEAIRNSKYTELKPVGSAPKAKPDNQVDDPQK